MTTLNKQVVWKDFDFRFRAHPVTGKLLVLKNNDALKQAVKLLVLTNRFERRFRPQIGSDIRAQLFELFDGMTEQNIKFAIETTIKEMEPRAILLHVEVAGNPDGNQLDVTIVFRPINSSQTTSFTLSLARLR